MVQFLLLPAIVIIFLSFFPLMAQSPSVMIDVDSSAQLAIEDEAPVLPDDFARNDPPKISANWLPSSSAEVKIPARITKCQRSASEISQWISENYKSNSTLSTDVTPRSMVWNHLVSEHGFQSHQVSNLPQWKALALHDAVHLGKIEPFEELSAMSPSSSSADGEDSGITLFTADDSWKNSCQPCKDQAAELARNPPNFKFKIVKGPKEGDSPSGLYPCWVGADGAQATGFMPKSTLEKWAKEHGKKTPANVPQEKSVEKPVTSVEIDSSKASAVMLALADHVARSSGPESLKVSGRSWLPEIDIDLDDPFLKVLDGLLSAEGFELGGAKISWPAGKRAISFDPPVDATYRKVLEVSAKVKSLEVSGREVVVRMDSRLIPDLKVILK